MRSTAELRLAWDEAGQLAQGLPFWLDPGFAEALAGSRTLREASGYFPRDLTSQVFEAQPGIDRLWSSYKDHGYGHLVYGLVRALQPRRCVEIGVLQGFSLLTAAAALRDNGHGTIEGFDLFEDYPFHREPYDAVVKRIGALDLAPWASVTRADACSVSARFEAVDYLHVDISNDGDTLRRAFQDWAHKVTKVMLFEGGGPERDRVAWMVEYGRPAISRAVDELRTRHSEWRLYVLRPFPSMTVALRTPLVAAGEKP